MSDMVDIKPENQYEINTILDSDGLDALLDCLFDQSLIREEIIKRIDVEEVLENKRLRDIKEIMDDYVTNNYTEEDIIDMFGNDIITNNLNYEIVQEYIQSEYFGNSRYRERNMSLFIEFISEILDGNEYEFFKQYLENDDDAASYFVDLLGDKFKEKYKIAEPVVENDKPNVNLDSIRNEIYSQLIKNFEEFNVDVTKFKDKLMSMVLKNIV